MIDHEQVKTNINKLGRQAVIVRVMIVSSNQIQVVGIRIKSHWLSVVNIKVLVMDTTTLEPVSISSVSDSDCVGFATNSSVTLSK